MAVVQRLHVYGAGRLQARTFSLQCGETLFTYEAGADPDIKMHPVLDGLPLGNTLEEQSWAHP